MTFEQDQHSRQPPGWYPEPGDRHAERYWDGTQWTPATRSAMAQSSSTRPTPGVGVLGLVLSLAGIAAAIIAFTAVKWLDFGLDQPGDTFSMSRIGSDMSIHSFVSTYCAWLGWLALLVAGLTSLAACLPVPNRSGVWAAAVAVALVALGLTFAAVVVLVHDAGDVHATKVGPWLALGGFAFVLFGAAAATVGATQTQPDQFVGSPR